MPGKRAQGVREYEAYYTHRSREEEAEELAMLAEWEPLDEEAWAILEEEEREARGRRSSR
jgi:hypothetical protein